jgi:hypothetical protein
MKFEDIRYVERSTKHGKTLGVYMPGGFFVFKTTLMKAWVSTKENWPNIDRTEKQTAESLIGSDVWSAQVNGAKKALGRSIKFFVKYDMLPLPLVVALTRKGKPYKGGKLFYVTDNTVNVGTVPVTARPAIRVARNRAFLGHVDWAALGKTTPTLNIGGTLP